MRYKASIYIAPRTGSTQAAKGDVKAAYGAPVEVTAAVYPLRGTEEAMPYGYRPDEMRLIFTQAEAEVGDGVFLSAPASGQKPEYTVVTKAKWPMHKEYTIGKAIR